jgi:hypothetical protein
MNKTMGIIVKAYVIINDILSEKMVFGKIGEILQNLNKNHL